MAARNKIYIYQSRNVSATELLARLHESFNNAAIDRAGADDIRRQNALDEKTLAFFLPGITNEDSPYSAEIGSEGNKAIRDYVEQGGIFVGICAGAYYACRDILYDPPWRDKPKTSRPGLDFFNALARGPLPQYGIHDPEPAWYSDCTAVEITYNHESSHPARATVAYGNGPALYPQGNDPDLDIIARYENVPGRPVAVAAQRIGQGLALFVGVLPFLKYEPHHENSGIERLQTLMDQLRPHEKERKEVWNSLVNIIKNHAASTGNRPKHDI